MAVTLTVQQFEEILNRIAPPAPVFPPSGLGHPGPLGLGGFALTTFTLSVYNTGVIIDPAMVGMVLPLGLFYGGLAQFIAGMWEFKRNDTFGATAFASYGAFWMSFAIYALVIKPEWSPTLGFTADPNHADGLFLFVWLIFTLYMTVASFRVSRVVNGVFILLSLTLFFLVVGALTPNVHLSRTGGWLGICCACVAWYGSAAVVINNTWRKTVLPIGVYKHEEETLPSHTPAKLDREPIRISVGDVESLPKGGQAA